MRILFISLVLLLGSLVSSGQAICGFDQRMEQLRNSDPAAAQRFDLNEQKIREYIAAHPQNRPGSVTTVYTIPVVVHVMHTGGAVGTIYNPSDANITGAIAYLNQIYAGTFAGMEAPFGGSTVVNMEINFVLAQRTPSCGYTNGIDRVDASSIPNYTANGVNQVNSTGCSDLTLKDFARWDPASYYNIWVVNKIDGADNGTAGQFIAGYAYFAGSAANVDGTVMLATQMISGQKTLPHEIGHALNLYHTFQGSSLNTTCPLNATCSTQGDLVCDTDPITDNVNSSGVFDFTCRSGTNTCTGTAYTKNTEKNFMSYTNCYTLFTDGQKTRVQAAMSLPGRASLAASSATTSCGAAINFTAATDSKTESTSGTVTGCRKYTDYTYQLSIGAAPTATATATLTYSGTATKGYDYDVTTNGSFVSPSNVLTFPSGATTSQSFTVRVFDDAATESSETAILNFTVNNGGGNASIGTTIPTLTITIGDNDIAPASGTALSGTIGTVSANIGGPFYGSQFDSRSQMLYTAAELQALGFTAGNITSIGYTVSAKNSTQAYSNFTVKLKNTTSTSTSGTFETGASPVFGPVAYTVPGTGAQTITLTTPFAWDGMSNLLVDICFDNSTATGNDNINAGSSSTSTYIAIASTNSTPGCSIASTGSLFTGLRPVLTFGLTPTATIISTVLNSTKTAYLGPNEDVYFYDGSGNILARIKNLTSFDYGCTAITIDRSGSNSAQFWNSTPANYLASKSIKVVPTINTASGHYQITMYYTSSEVTGWQTATGQTWANAKMAKVSNGFYIPDVTPAAPHTSDVSVITATPTTFGSNYSITGDFNTTGFSGFGVGVPGTAACPTITITNPATATGTANAAFSQTFTQSGAGASPAFTLNTGTLPAGLALSTSGVLSGTPTQTGSFPITVKVTDANSCVGTGSTYTLVISCQTITVTNPSTATGTSGTAFSQTFTQSGSIGTPAYSINSGSLPAGLSLSSITGVLSGTPTQGGTFPITVKVTDGNGCTGIGVTYNLAISCPTITVTNPSTTTGTANAAFNQTFTQSGAVGGATFTINSGTLPTGLTLSTAGVLSGTPTQTGSFAITVKAAGGGTCFGVGTTYTLVISCQTITVTNPATATGTSGTAFSQTFTQSGSIGTPVYTINTGTLPAGLTLSSTTGVLSGTPTQGGTFPVTVNVTDGNGCTGIGTTYNLVISCPTITVTNPSTTTGTANTAFTQTFTQSGAVGGATFTINSGTLPTGLSLSTAGVLSGTPMQTGSFAITVKAAGGGTCFGVGATYTLVISCQTITVTNPATATGTSGTAFSQTFTQSGSIGTPAYSINTGTLPAGLTLSSTTGALSGTPTQGGTFPITVKVTDGNGCTGIGGTYNLVISCPTITVTNPSTTTGTANAAFSQAFTQSGAVGGATFTINSGTLPTGLSLSTAGVLSGTPTQTGSFAITVKASGGGTCFGVGATYTLVISCQTITVNNPATATGTSGTAFSQAFTQSGSIGTPGYSINTGTLPAGLTLSSTTGVLSGTPTQGGTFPITVKVTDGNGCTGIGGTYNLVISCPTITVTNPSTTTGTANAAFSQAFTQSGAVGGATFTINSGTLPTGLSLSSAGVLSGTPTQTGSFAITVKAAGGGTCFGVGGTYTLVISCQTITVTNPATATGTSGTAFSQTFTQSGSIGTPAYTINTGTLPTGLTLSSTTGVLSGTPTQGGTFPITVKVTDGNGCTGIGATYNLVISCPTITVTNPSTTTGTANTAFSQTFTQSGAVGGATFTINSGTLPTGLSLSTAGVLSGTPTQTGSFAITVKAAGGGTCFGVGATYTLVISCQTITVTNPATATGTSGTAFNQTFTQSGSIGASAYTTNTGTLPAGLTLTSTTGVLSGTPTQGGTFPITVKVTDGNGCTGIGATYNLVISCPTITVTNPATSTGTSGTAFSQSFTQSGAVGGATFVLNSGTLPAGLTLSAAGLLSGTPTQGGTFPLTVRVNGGGTCTGVGGTYNLVISCPAITVTNPAVTTGTAGVVFSQTFTQSGAVGGATFVLNSGTLPTGLTLSSAGVLSGTPTQTGSFAVTVRVNGGGTCTGVGATYNLNIGCQTITVTNPSTTTGNSGTAFSQTFTQTGAVGGATFSLDTGTLPTGLSLSSSGVLSGTPTQTGSFPITIKVTGGNGCTGTGSTYNLTIGAGSTITVNLKLFLEGYYSGGGAMQPVLNNQNVASSLPTQTDTVTVELHNSSSGAFIAAKKAVLSTSGNVSATFSQSAGNYYIAVLHRNSVQTWTTSPVACTSSTPLYDFSTAANKAMGDNQKSLGGGVWGFFVGDLNQDEFVDPFDYEGYNTDNLNGVNSVYVATDMNGDGFVDPFDYGMYNDNNLAGVSSIHL